MKVRESEKCSCYIRNGPEAIKRAPLVKELESAPGLTPIVCVTAQHRAMLDQALRFFEIQTQTDLNVMKEGQSLYSLSADLLKGMEKVFQARKHDLVLVHGDTTTAFIGALAAYYAKVPVGHVEAGLRTYDKYAPFPEEMNRSGSAEWRICTLPRRHCPQQISKPRIVRLMCM